MTAVALNSDCWSLIIQLTSFNDLLSLRSTCCSFYNTILAQDKYVLFARHIGRRPTYFHCLLYGIEKPGPERLSIGGRINEDIIGLPLEGMIPRENIINSVRNIIRYYDPPLYLVENELLAYGYLTRDRALVSLFHCAGMKHHHTIVSDLLKFIPIDNVIDICYVDKSPCVICSVQCISYLYSEGRYAELARMITSEAIMARMGVDLGEIPINRINRIYRSCMTRTSRQFILYVHPRTYNRRTTRHIMPYVENFLHEYGERQNEPKILGTYMAFSQHICGGYEEDKRYIEAIGFVLDSPHYPLVLSLIIACANQGIKPAMTKERYWHIVELCGKDSADLLL